VGGLGPGKHGSPLNPALRRLVDAQCDKLATVVDRITLTLLATVDGTPNVKRIYTAHNGRTISSVFIIE